VSTLAEQYKAEKMPKRKDTRRTYQSWIRVHILPEWGQSPITDLQARPVELWLESLSLAPKSRGHIRGILNSLWNFAMWKQAIPMQVNPISLVTVKGASKRRTQPRSLTVEQFQKLIAELHEPHRTIALVCICFGLRISETLALRWSDVDWLNKRLRVERGIVERNVDDVKTEESRKSLVIADELLERLKVWKQATEFSTDNDWIFASPVKIGRLPYSYTGVWRELGRASEAASLGHMGTHTFRHSYRMWIDAIGTTVGVQQKLMRHSDIRTTMNIYGDAATEDMREAHNKIVGLALRAV
jgi:integrase